MNDTPEQRFANLGTVESFGPAPTAPLFSDESLALAFTQEHGDDLRYVAAWNKWLRWDGARWAEEKTLLAFDLARAICRDAAEGVNKFRVAKNLTASKTVAGVVALARVDRRHAATTDQWDVDPWVLNTPGGLIDLKTGRLLAHRRDAYCSKIAGATPGGDCPLWLAFLDRIFADDDYLIAFVQRLAGYALTGITTEHAMFFGHGKGANGKSVLVTTLTGAIGDYARTASIETFVTSPLERHPTDLAALRGARLVTATETEEGKHWSESRLKALTGGDKIAARFMRQDFFEYVPQFKLLVTGNHKPRLRSTDEAIRRRMNLIPFEVTIPEGERDEKLAEKLRAEWPGILAWCVQGCLDWQRIGLAQPQAVRAATAEYLRAEDAISTWLEEQCWRNPQAGTASNVLFADWTRWATAAGEFVGSLRRFNDELEARGFTVPRRSEGRYVIGLQLIPRDDEDYR